jgi:hypothetical protein
MSELLREFVDLMGSLIIAGSFRLFGSYRFGVLARRAAAFARFTAGRVSSAIPGRGGRFRSRDGKIVHKFLQAARIRRKIKVTFKLPDGLSRTWNIGRPQVEL